MRVGGFIKSSLVDYPGKVAAVVFTQGCNFRCPFCHNKELVIPSEFKPVLEPEEVISFLVKRQGILQGVVITGGEPTLQTDLREFVRRLKEIGYLVKLDTNGSRPDVLRQLLAENLLDYVAMDLKTSFANYPSAAGVPVETALLQESVEILQQSEVEYEFRTTLVRSVCSAEDLAEIAKVVASSRRWTLQPFVAAPDILNPAILDQRVYSEEEIAAWQNQTGRESRMFFDLPKELVCLLQNKVTPAVIFTAGNSLRQDDGVGPYIAARLKEGQISGVIDGGYSPDSVVEDVVTVAPARIIFIDAADFGGRPGEVRLLAPGKNLEVLVSSHTIPLAWVADLIATRVTATQHFIGIQVKSLDFGEGLCPEVLASADNLVSLISRHCPRA